MTALGRPGVAADAGGSAALDETGQLATYAVDLDVADLPAEIAIQARIVLADTIGVICSASRQHAVHTALQALPLEDGPCTVIGHGRGARPEIAAFINGIGGHDIELDDSHSPSRTHPAAVIVPACLAAAEFAPNATLGDLLAGIVAAYEVQARVSKAIGRNEQYARGFHPSAVVGAIGAAVGAGRILRLSVDEMRSCIALAAGQASGLLTYHDDPSHMAKSFQTGVAARNGVTAAIFARSGYRASPNAFTGRHDMLTPFGGPAVDASRLLDRLGEHYEISQTSFKRHACCGLTHSSVDAMLDLMRDHRLAFADIDAVAVTLPHGSRTVVDGNTLWTHNIQYVLAVTAHEGRVGLEHFSSTWTEDPRIQDFASRVTVDGSDRLEERFPEYKATIVEVTAGAERYTLEAEAPRGSPDYPLSRSELQDKFEYLAQAVMDADHAAALWHELVSASPDVPVRPIVDTLAAARAERGHASAD